MENIKPISPEAGYVFYFILFFPVKLYTEGVKMPLVVEPI
jgi:hypothetical protein